MNLNKKLKEQSAPQENRINKPSTASSKIILSSNLNSCGCC
jgi:hypothetical protein